MHSAARILIVEDDFLIGSDMQVILAEAGLVGIGPVGTPEEALRVIASERPAAALLDGNLNGKSAATVAHCLRDNSIPFAFVTGYGRDHLPAEFDAVPLIRKPFQPCVLVQTARALLKS